MSLLMQNVALARLPVGILLHLTPAVLAIGSIGPREAHVFPESDAERQAWAQAEWSREQEWTRTPPLNPTKHTSLGSFRDRTNCDPATAYPWGLMQPTRKGGVMFTYYHYFWEFAFPVYHAALTLHAAHGSVAGVIITTTSENAFAGSNQKGHEAGDYVHPEHGDPNYILNYVRDKWLGMLPATIFVREGLKPASSFSREQQVCAKWFQIGVKQSCNPLYKAGRDGVSPAECIGRLLDMHRWVVRHLHLSEQLQQTAVHQCSSRSSCLQPLSSDARSSRLLEVLVIKRGAKVTHSMLGNVDDVKVALQEELLKRNITGNIAVREMESIPHTEQLKLVHGADIVVLNRGSATANMVMLRPCTSVLIISDTYVSPTKGYEPTTFLRPLWYKDFHAKEVFAPKQTARSVADIATVKAAFGLALQNHAEQRLTDARCRDVDSGKIVTLDEKVVEAHAPSVVKPKVDAGLQSAEQQSVVPQQPSLCSWYALLHPCGGINNNRVSMMNALVYAKLQQLILVLPRVPVRTTMCHGNGPCAAAGGKMSWWRNTRSYEYLYDREHFAKAALALNVSWVDALPPCLAPFDPFRNQMNAMTIEWRHAPFPKGSGTLASSQRILADPTWSVARRCANGEAPHKLPGYHSNCQAGFADLECSLYSFKPQSATEWQLWEQAFRAFRFNAQVRAAAESLHRAIGGGFNSLHLRVEEDAAPSHFMGYPSREEGISGWATEVAKHADKSLPIYIAGGLPPDNPLVRRFTSQPTLTGYRFIFSLELMQNASAHFPPDAEMEFKAAVEYTLCLHAHVHMGTESSSYDFMLHTERKLRHTSKPSGKTINLHRGGRVDPELSKIFSPQMYP